jgi:hypothetical protein
MRAQHFHKAAIALAWAAHYPGGGSGSCCVDQEFSSRTCGQRARTISLFMLFSMQAMLRFDLCTEFGSLGRHIARATCYALIVVFLVSFVVETGRLVVAL